ncbi:hypothetical protein HZS_3618 [Henneguya salminicola]|nr:hypothetical protein HZS_3618 [Henneguya salminicola]
MNPLNKIVIGDVKWTKLTLSWSIDQKISNPLLSYSINHPSYSFNINIFPLYSDNNEDFRNARKIHDFVNTF